MALDNPRVSLQVLFRGGGWLANMTHPFMGPGAIKQAETNCGRRQNTSYLALQAEKTNNKWRKKKKKKFSLHYFINVSMRAHRRWEMTKMIRTLFQTNDSNDQITKQYSNLKVFLNSAWCWTTFLFGQFHLLEAQLT